MGSKLFSEEQLNFFKFASIVLDEFSKALREIFVTMWDTKIAPLPTYQTWDDSAAVRSMLLISEGSKTEIPTNKSLQEWDCTALFKATIYAQTFTITDSKGHKKTLSELYLKKKKLAPGSFHPSVNSPSGDSNETLALAIDQLRLLRNKLCHSKDSGIKKTTFDQYVQLTKDAFIAANVSPASVDAIGSLTESDFPTNKVNELKECIHELQASNRFLEEEIMDKICDVHEHTLFLDCQLRKLSHSILEVQEFTKTSPMIHEELRKIRSDLTQMTESQIEEEDDNDEKCPMSDTVDDVKDPLEILSTLQILPGKPFHKCCLRAGEVKKMTLLFESLSDTEELRVTTLYLTGPPGSGKTQLARQFGMQFLESTSSFEDSRPLVLTLSVDSTKSLLQSTKKLLDVLGITKTLEITKDDQEKNLARLYLEELRKLVKQYPGKWLLILDNMFRGEEINSILPQPGSEDWGRGKVIVTSQDSDLVPACHEYAKNYSLKTGMNKSDALALLADVSDIDVDEFAVELAEELEYFPLSLACSATYVGQMVADRPSSGFSWKQFLILYRNHKEDLTYRTFAAFNVYPCSMVVASRLAAKRLAECSQVLCHTFDFLSYCTLSPVPLVVVSNFVEARLTSKRFRGEEIKAEISRCSLILSAPTGFMAVESIKFHQVMGEAFKYVREEADSTNNFDGEARRKKYISMLKSLNESLDAAIPNYDSRSVALKILASPHVKSFVSHGNSKTWNNSAEFVVLLQHLADSLYHVPGIREAECIKYLELAYEIAGNLPHPVKDIRYCQVLKSLGFYYREAHHLDKSVGVLNEALALTENQSDNAWLALKSSTLNVLSWTYKLQMKLDLSEQTMKESIEIAKRAFGEQHEEIVERLCNLAIVYREKYQLEKAKETVDEARRLAEIATDELHLTRAQAANFSAKIYLRCAEVNDNSEEKHELLTTSLKLHSKALKIYENVLGENHIYVAGVCMTYAMVNKELKAYSLALEQVERAVKIYSDIEHVVLSTALRYKTEVLLALGNAGKEAEQSIKRSIELSNCGRARFLLASALLQQKRFQEARAIFKEVLTRWKSGILAPNHIWVKQAEKLKAECDREIFKIYFPRIVIIICVIVSVVLGFLMYS